MNGKSTTVAFVLATMALLLIAAPERAHAQKSVNGEVLVVLAKEEEGTIDRALQDESALKKPPFNSFQSMKVLDRPKVKLRVGQPQEVRLPNGRQLRIDLQQVLPDKRFRVRVSINRPKQNDYLPLLTVVASPGDPFFVAGQSYKGGTLVIGVRVGEEKGD